ncbi:MAG: sigma-70 family RNA polymerase sigma factor [Chloroflexi bacterium]|nr:sigma-70 family RNA polymerase sigma factor [Chloroflexota bacterium]
MAAFSRLVAAHAAPLYRFCHRLLGAGGHAEDLAQETRNSEHRPALPQAPGRQGGRFVAVDKRCRLLSNDARGWRD